MIESGVSERRRFLALALLAVCGSACATARLRPADATLRIYLARHGQTDWNLARRLQGHSDIELNSKGREQARLLGERVQGIPLAHVYSSTLRRSRETAEIARGAVALTSLPELMEQGLGKFLGQVIDEQHAEAREEFERRSRDPEDDLGGGESESQFVARVRTAIEKIRAASPAGSILVVGHGGTNRAILRILLNLGGEDAAKIQQANDELYLIELAPGAQARLWKWIDAAHLSEL
jgi:broad specificity phosphatase PhoE